MAFVLRWGVDSRGAFRQERSLVFPLLRTLPNNTHASLMYRMAADIPSLLGVNGLALQDERVGQVAIDGALEVRSLWGVGKMNVGSARDMKPEPVVEMTRTIFPSRTLPLMCERYMLRNVGAKPLTVSVPEFSQVITTDPAKGRHGQLCCAGRHRGQRHLYACRGGLACVRRRVPGLPGRRRAPAPRRGGRVRRPDGVRQGVHRREPRARNPRPGDRHPIPLCQAAGRREHRCDQGRLHARPPAANPTMRPSGPTTRPNTSTPSSPFWAMGWAMPRRSIRSAISPAS